MELMVVICIIAVLTKVAGPSIAKIYQDIKHQEALEDLRDFAMRVEYYLLINNEWPNVNISPSSVPEKFQWTLPRNKLNGNVYQVHYYNKVGSWNYSQSIHYKNSKGLHVWHTIVVKSSDLTFLSKKFKDIFWVGGLGYLCFWNDTVYNNAGGRVNEYL